MRTTVRLPEALLERAKKKASREGTTLTALIERGLRLVIEERKRPPAPALPRVSSRFGRQIVDVTNTSKLLERIEDPLPIEKRR